MEVHCVFCGNIAYIPIEEVVIHQPGTLSIRPKMAPEPYAEFKIKCPSCGRIFSVPCGVWHGEAEQDEPKVGCKVSFSEEKGWLKQHPSWPNKIT